MGLLNITVGFVKKKNITVGETQIQREGGEGERERKQ
jgi:hypothetical protein